LEETFASPQANPRYRLLQRAAQAVLKVLLPPSGTDLKGQMRSEAELRSASGYIDRPRDFDDLIHMLDPELRLITPTDPEEVAGDGWRVAGGNSDEPATLSAAGSLATCDGSGGEVLSGDQGVPEGGANWSGKLDPASGGIDPGQHRRGSGKGSHEGVSPP